MSAIERDAELVTESLMPGDAELVERFINSRDQAAFAELVRRHSHVVFGVCRRVLHDPHDIDDVFQATFLVFVRDAVRVRKRKSLASWLYGVAYRLSLRVVRQKQQRRETVLVDDSLIDDNAFKRLTDRHDQRIVDVELNALPDRYRLPLVLRYLAGKSTREIAVELGMTIGAVEGLLKRGKDELGTRLLRRGITFGAALVALQVAQQAARAADKEALISATIQAGTAWISGTSLVSSELISEQVVELAAKEMIAMTTATKTTIAIGITLGSLALGLGGTAMFGGPFVGKANAAGVNTVVSASRVAGEGIEFAVLGSDPNPKSHGTEPDRKSDQAGSNTGTVQNAVPQAGDGKAHAKWDFKPRNPIELRIQRALLETTEVQFTDVPLKDALDYLKEAHNVEIFVDNKSLSEEGVSIDTTVTLVMSGISLRSVLRLMLEPLLLDFVIEDEVMKITTMTKSNEIRSTMETRVYDTSRVSHLDARELKLIITSIVGPKRWHDSSSAVPAKPIETTNDAGAENKSIAGQAAATTATENSEGDAHKGSISAVGKTLVIRQTRRIHDEIVELLDQLELQKKEADEGTTSKSVNRQ